MIGNLINKVKGWWHKMFDYKKIVNDFGLDMETSESILNAIQTWSKIYNKQEPWIDENTKSLHVARTMCEKVAKAVTIEYKSTCSEPYIDGIYQKLLRKKRKYTEQMLGKSSVFFRPYFNGKDIKVNVVQADKFIPVAFDDDDNLTSYILIDQVVKEDKIYRIFFAVLSEEDAKEIEGEAQLFSDERIGTMVVCQEQEKEETVEESERGEIHTILRERDICKSNFANVNEYGNRTGYWESFSWEKDTGLVGYRSGYREGADLIEISRCDGGGISGTEKDGKNVSENENITFRVLDGKEISVSRDRLMDTERINNRWSLEETDAMIAPLKGTWTTDTYMGYVLPYNLRKFEPDTYADEEARETFFGEYHEEVRAAEESPVPDINVEVQPVEEYEDGYTIRVNGYESPFSIILSTERINDEYPIYSDTTTLSESFFVEYPVVYIKLFAKFKDGESDRYNPATVIVSADGQVLLLMEGAFYSLERR